MSVIMMNIQTPHNLTVIMPL